MKFLIKLLLIALLAFLLQPFSPWWVVMVLPFLVSAVIRSGGAVAFFSAFFAIGALWFWKAWMMDQESDSIMSGKIAALFGLEEVLHLILVTALVGGLTAGVGGFTGYTFRKLFEKKKSLYY